MTLLYGLHATGHNRDGIPFGQSGDTDSDISVVMGATSQDGTNWIKSDISTLIYDPQWGNSMKKDIICTSLVHIIVLL